MPLIFFRHHQFWMNYFVILLMKCILYSLKNCVHLIIWISPFYSPFIRFAQTVQWCWYMAQGVFSFCVPCSLLYPSVPRAYFQAFFQIQYGHRLDGSVVNSFPEFSFIDCVIECLVTPRCISVNYCTGAKFCEINYGDKVTPGTKSSNVSGWIYSDMTQWPKVIIVQCSYENIICATK